MLLVVELILIGIILVGGIKFGQLFDAFVLLRPKKVTKEMTKTSGETLSIALHHGVNAEGQLYRLKRGTKLRLVPGPSLIGRNVALYCNYPVTGKFTHSQIFDWNC